MRGLSGSKRTAGRAVPAGARTQTGPTAWGSPEPWRTEAPWKKDAPWKAEAPWKAFAPGGALGSAPVGPRDSPIEREAERMAAASTRGQPAADVPGVRLHHDAEAATLAAGL